MRFLNQIIAIRERDYQALLCFNPADHLESDIVVELSAVYTNITNTSNSVSKTQESTGERTLKPIAFSLLMWTVSSKCPTKELLCIMVAAYETY